MTSLSALSLATVICVVAIYAWNYLGDQRQYVATKRPTKPSAPLGRVMFFYLLISCPALSATAVLGFQVLPLFDNAPLLLAGNLVLLTAAGGFVWAKRTLGSNYSRCSDCYLPHQIVTAGPYRFVRHPIYSANLLLIIGFLVVSGSAIVLLNLVALWVLYRHSAAIEEQTLLAAYPAYAGYYHATPRFLPFAGGGTAKTATGLSAP
ncbi:MAG: isoprenylcysteine carboxylmethyltransferase family protein [Alphaproteobacteria bacterium]|nr:isoprenylcysteine carboxylmethyltransferase family protein [Alphaproteobacteria bacterium]